MIAFERYDESHVDEVRRTELYADRTDTVSQRYPAAGTANALVDLYIMSPDGSAKVKADLD